MQAIGYDVDADDYHSYVHGRLPYDLIKPDPQLRSILRSINQRKIIFTNSDRIHAMKALDRLGITDCFEQIICFETMNFNLSKATRPEEIPVILKPSMEAMNIAIEAAQVDPYRTLFLDDNVKNIAAGKAVGLQTVLESKLGYNQHVLWITSGSVSPLIKSLRFEPWVGRSTKTKEADYALEIVTDLVQVVPAIWFKEEEKDQKVTRTRSEMDFLATTAVGA
ncbi:hypothetical protein H5410_064305 [Solanum commersonii]|uniref:Uncharacterized protein n=1 Tax=Solanum commersonii TaxID=4109 RepID=A0A9J5VZV9_SOLCO|nr:hypothetical protein H5410_064305 [Solanum commersonii]